MEGEPKGETQGEETWKYEAWEDFRLMREHMVEARRRLDEIALGNCLFRETNEGQEGHPHEEQLVTGSVEYELAKKRRLLQEQSDAIARLRAGRAALTSTLRDLNIDQPDQPIADVLDVSNVSANEAEEVAEAPGHSASDLSDDSGSESPPSVADPESEPGRYSPEPGEEGQDEQGTLEMQKEAQQLRRDNLEMIDRLKSTLDYQHQLLQLLPGGPGGSTDDFTDTNEPGGTTYERDPGEISQEFIPRGTTGGYTETSMGGELSNCPVVDLAGILDFVTCSDRPEGVTSDTTSEMSEDSVLSQVEGHEGEGVLEAQREDELAAEARGKAEACISHLWAARRAKRLRKIHGGTTTEPDEDDKVFSEDDMDRDTAIDIDAYFATQTSSDSKLRRMLMVVLLVGLLVVVVVQLGFGGNFGPAMCNQGGLQWSGVPTCGVPKNGQWECSASHTSWMSWDQMPDCQGVISQAVDTFWDFRASLELATRSQGGGGRDSTGAYHLPSGWVGLYR